MTSKSNEGSPVTWRGTSFDELYQGQGPWKFSIPPIIPSKYHHVLFEMPATTHAPPKPHYNSHPKHWDDDYVKMPYSSQSLFLINHNDEEIIRPRWEVITEALLKPITNSIEFEQALHTYNSRLPKFEALHDFFNNILEEEEAEYFFSKILPGIINLALQLPEIVPGSLPLLKKNHCKSISLSQLQIACLLANAFLCTFIWRKEIAVGYPCVNFARLFASNGRAIRQQCVAEKLKAICHYFRRVITKHPVGCVTFERKFIPRNQMPRWDTIENNLANTRIHITSSGFIEDGLGLLQVDFANKFVGGGVLGYGCVQEEIRFTICPELLITRLFTEELGDSEALVCIGIERYSKYSGYGDTFIWEGNVNDDTPYDDYGRRRTSVSVIDATRFNRAKDQFHPSAMIRELNKAFVGFSCREKNNLAPVASGNWGCGAFRGDPYLKSLIQLMSCNAANRHLVYYSFGDEELRDQFYNMHLFLATNRITTCQLWRYLCKFCVADVSKDKLYSFIQQSHFDSRSQPTLKQFFTFNTKKSKSDLESSTNSSNSNNNNLRPRSDSTLDLISSSTPVASTSRKYPELEITKSPGPKKISKRPKSPQSGEKSGNKAKRSPVSSEDIISLIELMDGNLQKERDACVVIEESSLLSEIDKLGTVGTVEPSHSEKECEEIPMDVDDNETTSITSFLEQKKRKITDYFSRKSKPS